MIETCLVDGYPLRHRGDSHLLLVFDPSRRLARSEFEQLAGGLPGLVDTGESEGGELGTLHFVSLAESPALNGFRRSLPSYRIALLATVLSVLAHPTRKPQLFDTMVRWREVAAARGLSLWETAVQYEMDASAWSREKVITCMRAIQRAMHRQTHAVFEEDVVVPSGPFRPNMAEV